MYIIPLAWLYVVLMMSAAEALSPQGSVLGALITFVFYGALPIVLMVYFMRAPSRRRALRAQEAAETTVKAATASLQPDAGGVASGDPVTAVRKET